MYKKKDHFHSTQENLSESRIITKNLVYVIGLSSSIAYREKLIKYEYFGQYGTIIKIVVNKNKAYNQNNPNGPSYSAYVTYSKPKEASIAILSLDETMIDNHMIRASFGTTKYCQFFLKGIECTNKDCLFLHKIADENDIIKRGELNTNKYIFAEQHAYAMKIADIFNPEVKKKLMNCKKGNTVFPTPDLIYSAPFLIESERKYHKSHSHSQNKNVSNISSNNSCKNELPKAKSILISKSITSNVKEIIDENDNDNEIDNEIESRESKIDNSNDNSNNNTNNDSNNAINSNKINEKIEDDNNLKDSNLIKTETNQQIKLFESRDRSRFNFGNNNTFNKDSEGVNVPRHIQFLVNKKINLYNITKYMHQKIFDKFLQNESLSLLKKENNGNNNENLNSNKDNSFNNLDDGPKDEWTEFINETMINNENGKYNDEYINDFDKINSFIMNKCVYKN